MPYCKWEQSYQCTQPVNHQGPHKTWATEKINTLEAELAEAQSAADINRHDVGEVCRLNDKLEDELAEARKNGERMLGYLKRMFPYTTARLEDDVLGYFGEKSIDFVAAKAEGGEGDG